jgi:hypothetical protein
MCVDGAVLESREQTEMETFVTYIVDMMKENNLYYTQGGPIILSQVKCLTYVIGC